MNANIAEGDVDERSDLSASDFESDVQLTMGICLQLKKSMEEKDQIREQRNRKTESNSILGDDEVNGIVYNPDEEAVYNWGTIGMIVIVRKWSL